MKALIRSILDFVFSASPRLRTKLTNYLIAEKLTTRLKELESKGVPIRVVYDIGARHGDFTKGLKRVLPRAEFVLFEANEKCAKVLEGIGHPFVIGVLSSDARVVDFYDTDSTGDSYYRENTPRYDSIVATKRQTSTLDAVVRERRLPPADLIKVDTQGSELDILRGGEGALGGCSLVYLECPVVDYNSGAPSFQTYVDFLSARGFAPCELCEVHYAYGALVQLDVLFIRKDHLAKLQVGTALLPTFLGTKASESA
jgi:FkbM family methyltransferase